MLKFQGYAPQANKYNSPVVTPDYLLPNEELLKRAQNGDPSAQFVLGRALRSGHLGMRKDQNEGSKWILLAANNPIKSPAVLCAQGLCYELALGNIAVRDAEQAKQYYQQAINQGYIPAMYELASTLRDESFIVSTSSFAKRRVEHTQLDQHKLKQVVQLSNAAAEAKYPPAYALLSDCYASGHAVILSEPEAFRLLNLAEADGKGSGYSKMRLGDFHKNGWGDLKKNNTEAKKWYRAARDQGHDIENRLKSACTIS